MESQYIRNFAEHENESFIKSEQRAKIAQEVEAFLANGGEIKKEPIYVRLPDSKISTQQLKDGDNGSEARRREALRLHRRGFSDKIISAKLGISLITVRRYLNGGLGAIW
jgi:DNA-binding NarL/FixJ family response regulator